MQFCCSDLMHSEALSVAVDVYFTIRLLRFSSACSGLLCRGCAWPVGYIHSFHSKLDIVRSSTLLRANRCDLCTLFPADIVYSFRSQQLHPGFKAFHSHQFSDSHSTRQVLVRNYSEKLYYFCYSAFVTATDIHRTNVKMETVIYNRITMMNNAIIHHMT